MKPYHVEIYKDGKLNSGAWFETEAEAKAFLAEWIPASPDLTFSEVLLDDSAY